MNDISIFSNNKKELETVIKPIRIYSQDIGIEFVIERWAVHIMKKTKKNSNNNKNKKQNKTKQKK